MVSDYCIYVTKVTGPSVYTLHSSPKFPTVGANVVNFVPDFHKEVTNIPLQVCLLLRGLPFSNWYVN